MDELDDVDRSEEYITESAVVICSIEFQFRSKICRREFYHAVVLPIIVLQY